MTKRLDRAFVAVALVTGLALAQACSPPDGRHITGGPKDRGALVFLYPGADGACQAKAGPEKIAGKRNDKVVIDVANKCAADQEVRITFARDVEPLTATDTVRTSPGKSKMQFTITGTEPTIVHYTVEFRRAGSTDRWIAAEDPDLEIYVKLDANPGMPLVRAAPGRPVV